MIKDIVANLSVGASRDVATDFAVSVAATFGAHLTGVVFRYEPLAPMADGFPGKAMQSHPPSRPPWCEGRGQVDRHGRNGRRQHDPIACRRHLRRFPGHGRLRPFASAGVRSRRRYARDSELHDPSDPDVALSFYL